MNEKNAIFTRNAFVNGIGQTRSEGDGKRKEYEKDLYRLLFVANDENAENAIFGKSIR